MKPKRSQNDNGSDDIAKPRIQHASRLVRIEVWIVFGILLLGIAIFAFIAVTIRKKPQLVPNTYVAPSAPVASTITSEKAIELVRNQQDVIDYLTVAPEGIVDIGGSDDAQWLVHVYEVVNNHTATHNWYEVNKETGEITAMFEY